MLLSMEVEKSMNIPLNELLELYFHLVKLEQELYEPRCEKTSLRGFRPGPTLTGLYSHRRLLEISDLGRRGNLLSM